MMIKKSVNPNTPTLVIRFLNAMHHKDHATMASCLDLERNFQDVLPNGTLVNSAAELLKLHTVFMESKLTGFRPFDWNREFKANDSGQSENREFNSQDLECFIPFESGYFCRIAAEVDRPINLGDSESKIARYYMYLGLLIKDNFICHIQNTLFDPKIRKAG